MKLRIEKAIYGGAGLAHVPEDYPDADAGKAVFVPMTLPGELIEAQIIEHRNNFANAELDSIIEAAATRTTPGCPYYGVCGGCHYQHATYQQQLQMKAAILRETLERAKVFTGAAPEIKTFNGESLREEQWAYRNRIRLQVRPRSATGPAALCYRERRSHAMLAVDECPIAAAMLVRALQTVQRLAAQLAIDTLCEEIEFFTNAEQDAVLLSLQSGAADSDSVEAQLQSFCTKLQSELPELRGAAMFSTAAAPRNSKADQTRALAAEWGEQSLLYTAAGFKYRVSIGSFFQVNRFLIDGLVDLVTRGQTGELAWDLYAGAGLFARALTSSFRLVRAVESAPTSCGDLRHNLEGTAHKVVESSTLDFLRLQVAQNKSKKTPDLVVVDPPRAGLGSEVTALLARIAPREIVYVSCDAATLARDLRALIQSGYQLKHITMVDLFPQTFHLESVSRLSLR